MTQAEGGRPAEIFGFPIWNNSDEAVAARREFWCAFMNRRCNRSARFADIPLGVCSVEYRGAFRPICPERYVGAVEAGTDANVLDDIGRHCFGDLDNTLPLADIKTRRHDRIDCVLLQHKRFLPEIEDFVLVERQMLPVVHSRALATGLGDFLSGADVGKISLEFRLDQDQWTQQAIYRLLFLGLMCQAWNAKCYCIVDELSYRALTKQYGLEHGRYSPDHPIRFAVYELILKHGCLALELRRFASVSVEEIDRTRHQSQVPLSRGEFVEDLNQQWVKMMKRELRVVVSQRIRTKPFAQS